MACKGLCDHMPGTSRGKKAGQNMRYCTPCVRWFPVGVPDEQAVQCPCCNFTLRVRAKKKKGRHDRAVRLPLKLEALASPGHSASRNGAMGPCLQCGVNSCWQQLNDCSCGERQMCNDCTREHLAEVRKQALTVDVESVPSRLRMLLRRATVTGIPITDYGLRQVQKLATAAR